MNEIFDKLQQFRFQMACPCCGENRTTDDFALYLLFAQDQLQKPLIITSGYRCPKHNRTVPGHSDDSPSLYGVHADLAYFDAFQALAITKALLMVGFERLRIYDLVQALKLGKKSAHIHVDRHPKHPFPSLQIGNYNTI